MRRRRRLCDRAASRCLLVEVCLRALCSVDAAVVTTKVSSFLRQHRAILLSEQLAFEADKELAAIVQHARVHVPGRRTAAPTSSYSVQRRASTRCSSMMPNSTFTSTS